MFSPDYQLTAAEEQDGKVSPRGWFALATGLNLARDYSGPLARRYSRDLRPEGCSREIRNDSKLTRQFVSKTKALVSSVRQNVDQLLVS
jgi:hypothetical protein